MNCADCKSKDCYEGKDCFNGRGDPRPHLDEQDLHMLRTAAQIESEYYLKATRLEEIIEFAKRMEYQTLGVAFCVGLADEAKVIVEILGKHFTVHSVCCKAGGLNKQELGLSQIHSDRRESTCNPVGQARLLADAGTQLNLIVGLCIGHDILFTKHSAAPVTTFVVKDRVLAHNPLGAITSGYHRKNRF